MRERKGMSRRTSFPVGRDHVHRPEGAERLGERDDPFGPEPVVIGHEYDRGRISQVLPKVSGKEMVGATGLEPATPCTPCSRPDSRKLLKTHKYLISLNSYDITKDRIDGKNRVDGFHRAPIGHQT